MRVNRILKRTMAEGPYERFCIWVQGCSRHCKGCFAKDTWDKNGGYEQSADEIITQLDTVSSRIEGITLLGGEPFEQAPELALLAEHAQKLGLGVIAFTGGIYEELLESGDAGIKRLLDSVDLLIDGSFQQDKREHERPLVGSQNQRFIYLTDRYTEEQMMAYENRFEIRVDTQGNIKVNGMGNVELLTEALKKLYTDEES